MAELVRDTDPLATLCSILRADEIITPDSPEYLKSSQTWAAQRYADPRLVIRPTSLDALSGAIQYIYTTDLDFAIYGHGFLSSSAKDVVVNMSAFHDFSLDPQSDSVIIGVGQTWGDVYEKLAKVAPECGGKITASRC